MDSRKENRPTVEAPDLNFLVRLLSDHDGVLQAEVQHHLGVDDPVARLVERVLDVSVKDVQRLFVILRESPKEQKKEATTPRARAITSRGVTTTRTTQNSLQYLETARCPASRLWTTEIQSRSSPTQARESPIPVDEKQRRKHRVSPSCIRHHVTNTT